MARRGGPHRRDARLRSRSATSTTRPIPRSGSTSSARSTAAIDPLAGHGTFIAGLIHQACPDADIVAWRIVGADGLVVESNLVKALEDIAELARRHRDGEPGGHPIDVLSLSLGYYHETPEDELFDPTMYGILRRARRVRRRRGLLRRQRRHRPPRLPGGVHAVARSTAATVHAEQGVVPIVSVGALNPNGTTDALFSNTGTVGPHLRPRGRGDEHHPATFQGGFNADGQHRGVPAPRASIDPDDYIGGFALWSGTSFAAPALRGPAGRRLARHDRPGRRRPRGRRRPGWDAVA